MAFFSFTKQLWPSNTSIFLDQPKEKKKLIASQKSNFRTPTVLLSPHYSQISFHCLGSSEHRTCMREYLINVIISIYAHKYGGGEREGGSKECQYKDI